MLERQRNCHYLPTKRTTYGRSVLGLKCANICFLGLAFETVLPPILTVKVRKWAKTLAGFHLNSSLFSSVNQNSNAPI